MLESQVKGIGTWGICFGLRDLCQRVLFTSTPAGAFSLTLSHTHTYTLTSTHNTCYPGPVPGLFFPLLRLLCKTYRNTRSGYSLVLFFPASVCPLHKGRDLNIHCKVTFKTGATVSGRNEWVLEEYYWLKSKQDSNHPSLPSHGNHNKIMPSALSPQHEWVIK